MGAVGAGEAGSVLGMNTKVFSGGGQVSGVAPTGRHIESRNARQWSGSCSTTRRPRSPGKATG